MKKNFKIGSIFVILTLVTLTIVFFHQQKSIRLELYGNVEIRQVDIAFQVGGKLYQMIKEEGDEVYTGELIATLDDIDYRLDYNRAQADLIRAHAIFDDASAKYNRIQSLYDDHAVSQMEYETAVSNRDQASAALAMAMAVLSQAENRLNYTKIYAPCDGTINIRVREPGSIIGAGQTVYSIVQKRPMWVKCFVSEPWLSKISVNTPVTVHTDSVDLQNSSTYAYHGHVGYISPVAEFTPKYVQTPELRANLVYQVRVYIDDADEYLHQGMPVTLTLKAK